MKFHKAFETCCFYGKLRATLYSLLIMPFPSTLNLLSLPLGNKSVFVLTKYLVFMK